MLTTRYACTMRGKNPVRGEQKEETCDNADGVLSNAVKVTGQIPFAAAALRFIYNVDPRNGGKFYGLPNPDMRGMWLTADMLYPFMDPVLIAGIGPDLLQRRHWHLRINVGAVADLNGSSKLVIDYDKEHGTQYSLQYRVVWQILLDLSRQKEVHKEAAAIVMSQFYRFFDTLFDIDYHAFMRLWPHKVIEYYCMLRQKGTACAFNSCIFEQRQTRKKAAEQRAAAANPNKHANNNNNSNSNNKKPEEPKLMDDEEIDWDDPGNVVTKHKLRFRLSIKRAMALLKAEGIDFKDVDEVEDEGGEGDASEYFGKDQRSLFEFMKSDAHGADDDDDDERKATAKRRKVEASKPTKACIAMPVPADEAGDDDVAKLVKKEKAIVVMSTSSREARPQIPSMETIPMQDFVTAELLEWLEKMFHYEQQMFVNNRQLAEHISETNSKMEFVAHLDQNACWISLVILAKRGQLILHDCDTYEEVGLPNADAEAAFIKAAPAKNICICLPYAYNAESSLAMRLDALIKRNEDAAVQRADELRTEGVDFASLTKNNLAPEQIEGFVRAVVSPISIISGPAGTGKTELQKVICLYLHRLFKDTPKMGAGFLFASFKNDTVAQTKAAIEEILPSAVAESNTAQSSLTFRTVDSIIYRHRNGMDRDKEASSSSSSSSPQPWSVVFVEEASFVSTTKLDKLLEACGNISHLILFGDVLQLPPISPGFGFLHICNQLPAMRTQLVRNFRTESAEISNYLQHIRDMRPDAVSLRPATWTAGEARTSGCCYADFSIPSVEEVGYPNIHIPLCKALMAAIARLDPAKTSYADLMVVTPYNQVARAASVELNKYYFGINNEWGLMEVQSYALGKKAPSEQFHDSDKEDTLFMCNYTPRSKRSKREPAAPSAKPAMCIGSRVVFKKNMKEMDPNICTGRSGLITAIFDRFRDGSNDPKDKFNLQFSYKLTSEKTRVPEKIQYERCVIVDSTIIAVFPYGRGIDDLMELEGCCTVHRSQGRQSPIVIALFADFAQLATNDVLYTACSRAQNELIIFSNRGHWEKMMLTRSVPKNALLPDWLSFLLPHETLEKLDTLIKDVVVKVGVIAAEKAACGLLF